MRSKELSPEQAQTIAAELRQDNPEGVIIIQSRERGSLKRSLVLLGGVAIIAAGSLFGLNRVLQNNITDGTAGLTDPVAKAEKLTALGKTLAPKIDSAGSMCSDAKKSLDNASAMLEQNKPALDAIAAMAVQVQSKAPPAGNLALPMTTTSLPG